MMQVSLVSDGNRTGFQETVPPSHTFTENQLESIASVCFSSEIVSL